MAPYHSVYPEPGTLVERFSWELEARQRTESETAEYDQLQSDLLAERDRQRAENDRDIKRLDEIFKAKRPDDVIVFNKAKTQLLESMRKFQDLVPGARTKEPPTCWDDIMLAATKVQAQWETKAKDSRAGRARELVRKMCNGMNNHATAMKMLPTESEYLSVVGGSVSMIIKAAANHINICEAFARGMIEINDAVRLENLSHVYDTPVLQQLTMRLYAQIFSYLIKFMTWYADRSVTRLLKSFNENALRVFDDDLEQVKQVSSLLSRQIQLHVSADVRVSRLMLEDLSGDMRYLLRVSEVGERKAGIRDAANAHFVRELVRCEMERTRGEVRECMVGVMGAYREEVRSMLSGGGMVRLLKQQVSGTIRDVKELPDGNVGDDYEVEGITPRLDISATELIEKPAPFSVDIRFESRRFEDYFTWEHVHPHLNTSTRLLADAPFVARLNAFTTAMESQVLYSHGWANSEGTGILQHSALVYKTLAEEAGIPVISYFCDLSNEDPPTNRSRETVELSAMLYAMMRQLIDLLPAQNADDAFPLSEAKLSSLDGTLRTWSDALSLFEDLVRAVRLPLLIFVIHGINVFENDVEGTATRPLEDIVRCLTRLASPEAVGDGTVIKVLFTTYGISEALCNLLDEGSMVTCDTSSPATPTKMKRSRQVISY